MINKEIQNLKKLTSLKMCMFMHFGMLVLILISLWGGGYKIYLAHKLARLEGVTLGQLFGDVDIHGQFSGSYVTASKWLVEGVFRIVPIILFIAIWGLLIVLIRKNKQILDMGKWYQNRPRNGETSR